MWSWKKWWQRRSETACKGNCGGERLESEAKKGNGRVRRGNQKRKGRTVRNRLLLPVLARALIRRTRLRLSPSSRARQAASEPVGRQPPPVRRRWGLEVVIAAVPLLQPHNHGDRVDVAFPDGSLVQMHACRRAAAVAGVVCSPSCLFCIFFQGLAGPTKRRPRKSQPGVVPAQRVATDDLASRRYNRRRRRPVGAEPDVHKQERTH